MLLSRNLASIGWDFVLPHVDLTPARIQRSHDLALERRWQDAHFQQRNRRNRLAQNLSQSLNRRQPDPQTGERSRPRGHGESADGGLHESVAGEQLGDLRNKLCGKSAADQRRNLDHFEVAAIAQTAPRRAPARCCPACRKYR